MEITVQDLMTSSGVKFGTSGARGLAADMTDLVCYVYTKGFLQYLESIGELKDPFSGSCTLRYRKPHSSDHGDW